VSGRPAARRPVPARQGRRTRPIRRASARLTATRAGAALVLLGAAATIYLITTTSTFEYARLRLDGATYTKAASVEAALASVRGENLFRIDTEPLEAALADLPTVADARIDVELPDTLGVTLQEREPLLVWAVEDRRYLVDPDGLVFAELADVAGPDVADLPVIDDERRVSVGLGVGSSIDPVDLDAATRLASLVPGDVGSTAAGLQVGVTDENGFVLRATPGAWTAVFGFYTSSLRTPGLIPGQVRLLRSLMIGREPLVDRVILASETDGTFTTRPTPKPSASPRPSASPAP
jgi:POTRA domain, FtsQ-type